MCSCERVRCEVVSVCGGLARQSAASVQWPCSCELQRGNGACCLAHRAFVHVNTGIANAHLCLRSPGGYSTVTVFLSFGGRHAARAPKHINVSSQEASVHTISRSLLRDLETTRQRPHREHSLRERSLNLGLATGLLSNPKLVPSYRSIALRFRGSCGSADQMACLLKPPDRGVL